MGILSFFRRVRVHEIPHEPVCTAELEKSFQLLQETTADVTEAAANAAKVLKKKYGGSPDREKACFDALNSASDAVAFMDNDTNVFFCNDKFVQRFGYTSYKEVIGRSLQDVLHCHQFSKFDEMWQSVQSNHTWTKGCRKIKSRVTVVPMMNGQPRPIYYICTFKSIQKP